MIIQYVRYIYYIICNMTSYIHEIYESAPNMAAMKAVLHNLYFIVTLGTVLYFKVFDLRKVLYYKVRGSVNK